MFDGALQSTIGELSNCVLVFNLSKSNATKPDKNILVKSQRLLLCQVHILIRKIVGTCLLCNSERAKKSEERRGHDGLKQHYNRFIFIL